MSMCAPRMHRSLSLAAVSCQARCLGYKVIIHYCGCNVTCVPRAAVETMTAIGLSENVVGVARRRFNGHIY